MTEKTAPDACPDRAAFRAVAEEWLRACAPRNKVSTMNKYRNLLETYIYPGMGVRTLDQITHGFLEAQCNHLLQSGRKTGGGFRPKPFRTFSL